LGRTFIGWIAPACLAHLFDHLVGEREQLYLVCGTARMARCWSSAGAGKNQVDNINFISKGEGVTALTDDWEPTDL
jgi:hypothetical protein